MSTWDDLFTSLFFGVGSWLGVLILIVIFISSMLAWKYSTVIMLPVGVMMCIEYLNNQLSYQAITLMFAMLFMMAYLIKDVKQ